MIEQIPNLITIVRILAIAPICWLLWQHDYQNAFVLLLIAGLSDALDGYLARRYGWFTRLGAFLDPIADKLFVACVYIVLGLQAYLPWWLVSLVLGRDVIISGGALAFRWATGHLEMQPLRISKLNTTLQIILLALTLVNIALYSVPTWLQVSVQWAVAISTLSSGLAYMVLWTRNAMKESHALKQP